MTKAPDSDELNLDDFLAEAQELGLLAKPKPPARRAGPIPRPRMTRLRPLYTPESLCLLVERVRCRTCFSEYMVPRNVLLWGCDKDTGAARGLAVDTASGFQDLPRTLRYIDGQVNACPACFPSTAPVESGLPISPEITSKLNGDDYHYIYHWTEPFTDHIPPGREEWVPPVPPDDDFTLDFSNEGVPE